MSDTKDAKESDTTDTKKSGSPRIFRSYMPLAKPPPHIPSYSERSDGITISMIKKTLFTFVYIWTKDAEEFWMFPVSLTLDGMLSGFRWMVDFWEAAYVQTNEIDQFFP